MPATSPDAEIFSGMTGGIVFDRAGQAEVEDVGLAVGADEDVGRLEVAVDDAVVVGVLHGHRDRADELEDLPLVEAVLADVLVERLAVDELHGEVADAVMRRRCRRCGRCWGARVRR